MYFECTEKTFNAIFKKLINISYKFIIVKKIIEYL